MPSLPAILQNEKELFAGLADDDEAAFTKIFDYYEPRLFPFILKITHSETLAEEIIQEIFIKLWVNRKKLSHVENYRSYIFKIASNKALNHLREAGRKCELIKRVTRLSSEEENTTEEAIDLRQLQQYIDNAVRQLPKQQKKVYKLSRQQGLDYDQIAKELHISRNTVKNHLTEALKSIKEYLQHHTGISITVLLIVIGSR